jgi:hypothetical protein
MQELLVDFITWLAFGRGTVIELSPPCEKMGLSRPRLVDPHFQPGTRPACSTHLCISGPSASSSVFTLT